LTSAQNSDEIPSESNYDNYYGSTAVNT